MMNNIYNEQDLRHIQELPDSSDGLEEMENDMLNYEIIMEELEESGSTSDFETSEIEAVVERYIMP